VYRDRIDFLPELKTYFLIDFDSADPSVTFSEFLSRAHRKYPKAKATLITGEVVASGDSNKPRQSSTQNIARRAIATGCRHWWYSCDTRISSAGY